MLRFGIYTEQQYRRAGLQRRDLGAQDRAASHCLTSRDWAQRIFAAHSHADFEASDLILCLYELSLASGETYIVEPGGEPLQYIRPPFVLSVRHREPRRYLLNLWLGARARRRFTRLGLPEGWQQSETGPGYRVRRISCVHPRAAALAARDPRFKVRTRSVFEVRRRHATCCER